MRLVITHEVQRVKSISARRQQLRRRGDELGVGIRISNVSGNPYDRKDPVIILRLNGCAP